MDGIKNDSVELSPYKTEWQYKAGQMISLLKKILAPYAVKVEHIGSTAIESITSVPVIDIVIGVADMKSTESMLPLLGSLNITRKDEFGNPGEIFLSGGNDSPDIIEYSIHITLYKSEAYENYINFTAYLNTHTDKARGYEKLKRSLADKYPKDYVSYYKGKAAMVTELTREAASYAYLGKMVTAVAEEQEESQAFDYPVGNYTVEQGYITEPAYADGKRHKAYILRHGEDPFELRGEVIAYVHRFDHPENMLIVAPAGTLIDQAELSRLVAYYENKYITKITSTYEVSCGAALYRDTEEGRKYLIIKSVKGHYGLPKGHMEADETEEQAALREIKEETGVNAEIIEGFRQSVRYTVAEKTLKTVIYFLARYDSEDISIQEEEVSEYKLLPYNRALETLTNTNDKKILEKAEEYISVRK